VAREDDPLDPFGGNRPYWQRHYGIVRGAHATPRGRRGCLLFLYVGFALIVLALLLGLASNLSGR
jgi:hypothetical protein